MSNDSQCILLHGKQLETAIVAEGSVMLHLRSALHQAQSLRKDTSDFERH